MMQPRHHILHGYKNRTLALLSNLFPVLEASKNGKSWIWDQKLWHICAWEIKAAHPGL